VKKFLPSNDVRLIRRLLLSSFIHQSKSYENLLRQKKGKNPFLTKRIYGIKIEPQLNWVFINFLVAPHEMLEFSTSSWTVWLYPNYIENLLAYTSAQKFEESQYVH